MTKLAASLLLVSLVSSIAYAVVSLLADVIANALDEEEVRS